MWQRVAFVPISWLLHAVLSIPAVIAGIALQSVGRPALVNRGVAFVAGLPIVLFAMRQSTWFTQEMSSAEIERRAEDEGRQVTLALAVLMIALTIGGAAWMVSAYLTELGVIGSLP